MIASRPKRNEIACFFLNAIRTPSRRAIHRAIRRAIPRPSSSNSVGPDDAMLAMTERSSLVPDQRHGIVPQTDPRQRAPQRVIDQTDSSFGKSVAAGSHFTPFASNLRVPAIQWSAQPASASLRSRFTARHFESVSGKNTQFCPKKPAYLTRLTSSAEPMHVVNSSYSLERGVVISVPLE